jgi:hypothetical protein
MKKIVYLFIPTLFLLLIASYLASLSYLKGYFDAPSLVVPIKNNQVVYEASVPQPSVTTMTKLTMISESTERLEMELEYYYDGSLGEQATLCGEIKRSYDPENIHFYWSCRPSGVKAGKGKAKLSFGLDDKSHEKSEIIISDQIRLVFYAHNPYRTVQVGKVSYYKAWIPKALSEKSKPNWQKASGIEYIQGFYHAMVD